MRYTHGHQTYGKQLVRCRDLIHWTSPAYTQSTVLLRERSDGQLAPDVTVLADCPPVFQLLAASVPMLQALQSSSTETGELKVAVIGAGACILPSYLAHVHDQAHVDAVDIDSGTFPSPAEHYEHPVSQQASVMQLATDGLYVRSPATTVL